MLKPGFDTSDMPVLFSLTATKLGCTNDGGNHEVEHR